METMIFLAAFLYEAGFAIYCIRTKSNQWKVGNLVRIGAFAGFVILALAAVIRWSFRWYGFAVLLFVWAVLAGWALTRSKRFKRPEREASEFKTGRILLKAAYRLLFAAIALSPAWAFPEHELIETTGKHQVATAQYTYTDKDRLETYADTDNARKLNVAFWYPKDTTAAAGHTYPLVVYSHGSFGIKSSNESLFYELASHGFVVCSIDHTYHSLFTTDVDGNTTWIDMGYLQEVNAQDAHFKKQQSYEFFQKWMGIRTGDINFVIDTIIALAEDNAADAVYKLVDPTKIGVMGHSLGGSAALGIGRMRADIGAVAALEAPFLNDIEGVENGAFVFLDEVYPAPVLNVYSDASWSHLSEWDQYAENYQLLSGTQATAYTVYIQGAGHLSLTDLALTSPILTRILNQQESPTGSRYSLSIINKVCLEFFDSFLKDAGNFTSAGTY